jgi:hypothetical protein
VIQTRARVQQIQRLASTREKRTWLLLQIQPIVNANHHLMRWLRRFHRRRRGQIGPTMHDENTVLTIPDLTRNTRTSSGALQSGLEWMQSAIVATPEKTGIAQTTARMRVTNRWRCVAITIHALANDTRIAGANAFNGIAGAGGNRIDRARHLLANGHGIDGGAQVRVMRANIGRIARSARHFSEFHSVSSA